MRMKKHHKGCPPDYNPGFCYDECDCEKCWEGWEKEQIDNFLNQPCYERRPFFVYDWMVEMYPEAVDAIAKNMFNGEVIILPTKYEE